MPNTDNDSTSDGDASGAARTNERERRLERLENLGLLATRVAHDLNNMLGPMKMAIPLLRPSVADDSARNVLASVETTVEHATALVRQILDYADGTGGQMQQVPVDQLLEEIVLFAQATFPRSIRVEQNVPPDLWWIDANLSQIHQVLLNLCVNARDAMGEGGTLSLGAENCRLDETEATRISGARAGSFLVLQVVDTGTGFSPQVMAKIWEPFMTTKKTGQGSGLGLSTVRDIVAHHEGFIHLRTALGKGSCFRIYLPAAKVSEARLGAVSVRTRTQNLSSPRVRTSS